MSAASTPPAGRRARGVGIVTSGDPRVDQRDDEAVHGVTHHGADRRHPTAISHELDDYVVPWLVDPPTGRRRHRGACDGNVDPGTRAACSVIRTAPTSGSVNVTRGSACCSKGSGSSPRMSPAAIRAWWTATWVKAPLPGDVADGPHAIGDAQAPVDRQASAVGRDADVVQSHRRRVGPPTSGHQHLLARDDRPVSQVDCVATAVPVDRGGRDTHPHIDRVSRERVSYNPACLGILEGKQAVEGLDDRDAGPRHRDPSR